MAAGLVTHNFEPAAGVSFQVVSWVPDTALPDVGAIPVHITLNNVGAVISPATEGTVAAILAKIIAAPATAQKQDELNAILVASGMAPGSIAAPSPDVVTVLQARPGTGVITTVPSLTTVQNALVANAGRAGCYFKNTDDFTAYLRPGAGATTAVGGYMETIASGGSWDPEIPYSGLWTVIWDGNGTGSLVVTEFTA